MPFYLSTLGAQLDVMGVTIHCDPSACRVLKSEQMASHRSGRFAAPRMALISAALREFCSVPIGCDFRPFSTVLHSLAGSPCRRFYAALKPACSKFRTRPHFAPRGAKAGVHLAPELDE